MRLKTSSVKYWPFCIGVNVILERVVRLVMVVPMAIIVLGLDAVRDETINSVEHYERQMASLGESCVHTCDGDD